MRKLLAAAIAATLAAGIGVATSASASTQAAPQFTCSHFQDPTVELVWSHVCRF